MLQYILNHDRSAHVSKNAAVCGLLRTNISYVHERAYATPLLSPRLSLYCECVPHSIDQGTTHSCILPGACAMPVATQSRPPVIQVP